MDENFVEAAPVGLILGFVAKVPFTKDTGSVAGLLQLLGQGRRPKGQPLALKDGMGNPVLELVPARQQRTARRGASRRDLEIDKPYAFRPEAIKVGRLQDRITVGREVTVALVVG